MKHYLLALLLVALTASGCPAVGPQPTSAGGGSPSAAGVALRGRQLLVNGQPFTIKGVGYSPVPIGVDPEIAPPYGDYYTSNYSPIYARDLPLLRAMGANTIRMWGWNNSADHTDFLDAAYHNGQDPIYVIVTFWMGLSLYPDISSLPAREQIKTNFRSMVAAHKNHPAVLMWAIGNELNASWTYGDRLVDLFSLIDEMAQQAHDEEGATPHPVTTVLADIDLLNILTTYDPAMGNLDVWSANVYRGPSFGSLFDDYAAASSKPLAILEYGIDAYDEAQGNEYELLGEPLQAAYAGSLWGEIAAQTEICLGGSIMAYADEWWKGKYGQGGSGCPDSDPSLHSRCGYSSGSHPDGFSNEEWWGILRTSDNGANPDSLEPRAAYDKLKSLWLPGTVYLPVVRTTMQ